MKTFMQTNLVHAFDTCKLLQKHNPCHNQQLQRYSWKNQFDQGMHEKCDQKQISPSSRTLRTQNRHSVKTKAGANWNCLG